MLLSNPVIQNLIWLLFLCSIVVSATFYNPKTPETRLVCGTSKLPANGNFIPNLLKVMDNISSQVFDQGWGIGDVISPLPEIYVLAQCHGNLSPDICDFCFTQSRTRLPRCPYASSARIYFDGCFLRYDTYSFFNESIDPRFDYVNCTAPTSVLADNKMAVEFKNKVGRVIKNVMKTAGRNGGFAVAELRGGVVSVYALAQCWKTLGDDECRECLDEAGSKLMNCAPGAEGRALYTGCYMRYSTDRFFGDVPTSMDNDAIFSSGILVAIILGVTAFTLLICFGAFIGYERLEKRREAQIGLNMLQASANKNLNFNYEVLERATDFFNSSRKLGQGGAGSVYRGTLPDGRTVAVKKLFFNTGEWVDQFFNEVNLISGIQHKNLVRLLGCSIEGPESLLVYEYVPNRSLDQILFVQNTVHILSWQQRFHIITGTAEGLAYLHGGAGVKIIHRDIKTSNILLDENLTPKIADFGLARCVSPDKSNISTAIAGTLGYMAPEYLVRGKLTEKADVYAFGVLSLEVATGRKNSVFSQGSSSILYCVWKHYKAKTLSDSIDSGLKGRFPKEEASKVLQIGLLCTQASVALRPTMYQVVQMLKDINHLIPSPKQPPFLNASVLSSDDPTRSSSLSYSLALNDQLEVEMSYSYTSKSSNESNGPPTSEASEPRQPYHIFSTSEVCTYNSSP